MEQDLIGSLAVIMHSMRARFDASCAIDDHHSVPRP